jgi:hypothetical protein
MVKNVRVEVVLNPLNMFGLVHAKPYFVPIPIPYLAESTESRMIISLELLAQMNTFSNTDPLVDMKTTGQRIEYAARCAGTVNTDRFDYLAPKENVVANTAFVAYGLQRQTAYKTRDLPFWREPAQQ